MDEALDGAGSSSAAEVALIPQRNPLQIRKGMASSSAWSGSLAAVSVRLEGLVTRRLGAVALSRIEVEPVVLLQGARTVGKSTLLRWIAHALGAGVLDLDDIATRAAMLADPQTLVARQELVCIDEYQHVPEVLDVIKAELNSDDRPGRFVLTGSTRHEALPQAAQALTGRLHRLPVYPLSQGEIDAVDEQFLTVLIEGRVDELLRRSGQTTRSEYIERIVAGGLPAALRRAPGSNRARWFDDYLRLALERDVRDLSRLEQGALLPRLLERLAGQTGQVLNIAKAAAPLQITERTADNYVRLLEAVFLLRRLPAWGTTLTSRSAARPKVHMVDSGVAARLLRLTPEKLNHRAPSALTELGHLLETFVVGELLKQASWLDGIAGLGHWRTRDGDEVDFVVERDDGAVLAFEVKAAQRVADRDLRPMRKLQLASGSRFARGVILYLGSHAYRADDRLLVLPVDALWTV